MSDGPEPHGGAGDATALEELDAEGTAGEPIVLPIAAGPATGYAWRLELPQEVEQLEDGPARAVDPDRRLGGAAGGFLRVTAPRGEHVLVARLARPWDPTSRCAPSASGCTSADHRRAVLRPAAARPEHRAPMPGGRQPLNLAAFAFVTSAVPVSTFAATGRALTTFQSVCMP